MAESRRAASTHWVERRGEQRAYRLHARAWSSRLRDVFVAGTLAVALATLCACTSAPGRNERSDVYPLADCREAGKEPCRTPFFAQAGSIAPRVPEAFPRRYLELWNAQVRVEECKDAGQAAGACKARLDDLNAYFNPKGPPGADEIGVALEGGGNKSAPFSLGVLAGIDQVGWWDRVGAIASVSGGSYAASFYFNRMFDLYSGAKPTSQEVTDARAAWFRSCIPDAFTRDGRHYFDHIDIRSYRCGESAPQYAFLERYRDQQQVWMHPDVLRLDNAVTGATDESLHFDDMANLFALAGMTVATVPFQFLARTVFRWPVNSSPSRLAYRLGLEREYGYSRDDWVKALADDAEPVLLQTLNVRRSERTLPALAGKLPDHAPNWILLTSAPGYIDGVAWLTPSPRDPVRQQFELTPTGFGSGIYGYARARPDAPFDWFGAHPNGLPILDAVVASAAFFDDNEVLVSTQPTRLLIAAGQQLFNLEWFYEVRNSNVDDQERTLARALPWPLYLGATTLESTTPYIHLQDGGNAENAGILPLLRRGYRTIVYAHGTTDVEARFAAICHLKNQLEFDGNYYIVSPDLQALVDGLPVTDDDRAEMDASRSNAQGSFLNYLDQLCSQQIDASDLVAFDRNERREDPDQRVKAVAKLFCGRIGRYAMLADVAYPKRAQPDKDYKPCAEYLRRFRWYGVDAGTCANCAGGGLPLTFPVRRALFYQTSGRPLRFNVCRGDALQLADATRKGRKPVPDKPLSTVVSVLPSVAWDDVEHSIDPAPGGTHGKDWKAFCEASMDDRRKTTIRACEAPNGTPLVAGGFRISAERTLLPCATLAHVLEDKCKSIDPLGIDIRHPAFPQDKLGTLTLHIPYLTYAGYFELGRAYARHAFAKVVEQGLGDDEASACAIPIGKPVS